MRLTILVASLNLGLAFAADYYYSLCTTLVSKNRAAPCARRDYRCQCSNSTHLMSVYSCISEAASLLGAKNAVSDSWESGNERCSYSGLELPAYTEVAGWIDANPINQTFAEANKTGHGAFTTPVEVIKKDIIKAGVAMHKQRIAQEPYAEGRIGYVFGIMLLQIIANFASWVAPAINRIFAKTSIGRVTRKYLILPPLFGKYHAHPFEFGGFQVCIPLRIHGLLILGYVILTVVLLAVNFPVVLSPYVYYKTKALFISAYLGERTGIFAAMEFPLLILFAGRNNFLIWMTGWDQSTFILWHRWIARIFTAELGIHAIAYTIHAGLAGFLNASYQETYFIYGVVGLLGMFFACMTGLTRTIREHGYDAFVAAHIIFAVAAVVGTWWHLKLLETLMQTMYAVVAIWAFDRLMRLMRVVANNPWASCDVRVHNDVLELTLHYWGLWKPRAGTFVYVHFMDPLRFWQSHPFTVVEPAKDEERGKIKLYARARSGITDVVLKNAILGRKSWHAWIDGPYGSGFNTKPFRELVFIAGGIGVTAIDSHLNHVLKRQESEKQQLYMHWIMPDDSPTTWFSNELNRLPSRVDVRLHVTRSCNASSVSSSSSHPKVNSEGDLAPEPQTVTYEDEASDNATSSIHKDKAAETTIRSLTWKRPSISSIIENHIVNSQGSICFFVCGPGRLADDVRQAVTMHLGRTHNYVQLYEESFLM